MRISDWSSDVCSSDLVVQLQCFSVDGPKSRILKSLYGDTDLPIGSHHWTSPNRPVVVQATRVAALDGKTVTLGDPLLHDIRADQPAVVADWQHLNNVGIQNLRLQFPEAQAFGHQLESWEERSVGKGCVKRVRTRLS